jgi:hypothetical protein
MIEQIDIEDKIKNLVDYELNKGVKILRHSMKKSVKHPGLKMSVMQNSPANRNHIYDTVADQLGVHRVMVRRIARKLISDYVQKFQILSNDLFSVNEYKKKN